MKICRFAVLFALLATAGFAAEDLFAETKKKAEAGDAFAQRYLGIMYEFGEGVPKDDAEAVKWYRKAADQGHAAAQSNLGVSYANGTGVPKDLVQAHVWWNIAGAKGYEKAKENLAIVEKGMTDSQKEKAMDLARELFAKLQKGK
ncbi:MAG: sel1 repeat family protein [Lacunisphaera sp.]|nr:sel1 repeat family protein [Lacunisphaera sp.]